MPEVEESDAKKKLRAAIRLSREAQTIFYRKMELMLDCDSAEAAVDADENHVLNERLAETAMTLADLLKSA